MKDLILLCSLPAHSLTLEYREHSVQGALPRIQDNDLKNLSWIWGKAPCTECSRYWSEPEANEAVLINIARINHNKLSKNW